MKVAFDEIYNMIGKTVQVPFVTSLPSSHSDIALLLGTTQCSQAANARYEKDIGEVSLQA